MSARFANVFPVQTEQTSNIYYMANTFQIWKELQANFINLDACSRVYE